MTARMPGRVYQPWCNTCAGPPDADCPDDHGKQDGRWVRRWLKRELRRDRRGGDDRRFRLPLDLALAHVGTTWPATQGAVVR